MCRHIGVSVHVVAILRRLSTCSSQALFIAFSDPRNLACKRFNKGFELELVSKKSIVFDCNAIFINVSTGSGNGSF